MRTVVIDGPRVSRLLASGYGTSGISEIVDGVLKAGCL
jgi:hypothetical protein